VFIAPSLILPFELAEKLVNAVPLKVKVNGMVTKADELSS
jgi:hypothetical protein